MNCSEAASSTSKKPLKSLSSGHPASGRVPALRIVSAPCRLAPAAQYRSASRRHGRRPVMVARTRRVPSALSFDIEGYGSEG